MPPWPWFWRVPSHPGDQGPYPRPHHASFAEEGAARLRWLCHLRRVAFRRVIREAWRRSRAATLFSLRLARDRLVPDVWSPLARFLGFPGEVGEEEEEEGEEGGSAPGPGAGAP